MESLKVSFGRNLEKARNAKGLSQTALATMVFGDSTKQGQISKYENGTTAPAIDTAVSIAQALGVSLDELCGLGEKEQKQESTPIQWLSFLDQLLDRDYVILKYNEIEEFPQGNYYSIDFHHDELNHFFKSYRAMRILKHDFSPDDYQNIAQNLFSRYEYAFMPKYYDELAEAERQWHQSFI